MVAQEELAAIQQERTDLTERLAWIENRINQLNGFIGAVTPLIENDPGRVAAEAGLTNVCRDLLEKSDQWFAASEIRTMLGSMGIDIGSYTNPMAVLHAVLKRVGQTYKDPASGQALYGSRSLRIPLVPSIGSQYISSNNLKDVARTNPIAAPKPVPAPTGYRKIRVTMPPPGSKK
jgi:hypothetical protein